VKGPSAPRAGIVLRLAVAAATSLSSLAAVSQIPPPPPASTPTPAPGSPALKTLVGEVVRVDAAHGVIVVGESVKASYVKPGAKHKDPVARTVDKATKLTRGTRAAGLADVKAGDHAVVKYVASAMGGRALSVRLADVPVHAADATGASASRTTAVSPD